MKTSDKILLISSLSSLGIFGLVHLTLYANYERGKIFSEKDLRQPSLYSLPSPRYLVVRGLLQTRVIPSDTFSLSFQNGMSNSRVIELKQSGNSDTENTTIPSYRRDGDTLFVEGETGRDINQRNADMMIQWPFPVVNVYCQNLELIEVEGGQMTLVGGTSPGGTKIPAQRSRLIARNSILWVGQYHLWSDPVYPEFFDTLQIQASGSTVMLNHLSSVDRLHVDLIDHSYMNDLEMGIGQLEISCDSLSRTTLTGTNLQKLHSAGP